MYHILEYDINYIAVKQHITSKYIEPVQTAVLSSQASTKSDRCFFLTYPFFSWLHVNPQSASLHEYHLYCRETTHYLKIHGTCSDRGPIITDLNKVTQMFFLKLSVFQLIACQSSIKIIAWIPSIFQETTHYLKIDGISSDRGPIITGINKVTQMFFLS